MIVTGSYSSRREISAQPLRRRHLDNKYKNNPITDVLLTVHLLEVGDLVEIAHIDDGKVLDSIGDAYKYARSISVA
jgi:hypothetical protein